MTDSVQATGRIVGIFRSLRFPNFRLYWLGQLVSLNGTWMQSVAQAWLIYRLTGSSFMLGLVTFCNLAPVLLLSLVGGATADRLDRRKILITVHSLAMVQALILGALTLSDMVEPWHVVVLAAGLGLTRAFEVPARHALVAEIVPREQLANAIALNSSTFNVARFAGPAIAGVLVALYGEGPVFIVNALSFLAILSALVAMRVEARSAPIMRERLAAHMLQGLRFAISHRQIRSGLMMIGMISLLSSAVTVLMPVFAGEFYGGGSATLGWLLSAMGIGALLGALRLAARPVGAALEGVIGWAGVGLALSALIFSTLHLLWLALMVLAVAGFCHTTAAASTNTVIQLNTDDALRGRVMAVFSMVFLGLMPIGALTGGWLAGHVGATATMVLFSTGLLLVAVLYLWAESRAERLSAAVACRGSGAERI